MHVDIEKQKRGDFLKPQVKENVWHLNGSNQKLENDWGPSRNECPGPMRSNDKQLLGRHVSASDRAHRGVTCPYTRVALSLLKLAKSSRAATCKTASAGQN